jgi:hypothetical protein
MDALENVLDDLLLVGGRGVDPVTAFLEFVTLVDEKVTSPPSSTTSCGPLSPGNEMALRVRSQYSSSVSPFHAKTGVPDLAMAEAA